MRNTIGPIALILQLGATIVVTTLLPLFAGLWLDGQFNTTPWITLIGLGVGVIAAVAAVYTTISSVYKRLS
ncbi:MAG: AtpZ/AtpI family protein [Chloroflexota bacterium]|nr:AtpZ/AtpI family protein [Chloroflexota bacterium]